MTTQLCTTCKGSKLIAPLGGITKKCELCSGVGYIELLNPLTLPIEPDSIDNVQSKPFTILTTKLDKRSKEYRQSIGRL